MRSVGFGLRAGAVFIASVVVFASMIVIADSLKPPPETVALRPVGGGLPAEVASDGLDGPVELGDLRQLGAASSRARPGAVVTATPVPVDDTAPRGPAAASSTTTGTAERDSSGQNSSGSSSGAKKAKAKKDRSRTTNAQVRPGAGGPSREPKPTKDPKPQPDPTPDPPPTPDPTPTSDPTPTPTETPSAPSASEGGATSEPPTAP